LSRVQIADQSGSLYVNLSDEIATKLLNLTAERAQQEWQAALDLDEEQRKVYLKNTYEKMLGQSIELQTVTQLEE